MDLIGSILGKNNRDKSKEQTRIELKI